MTKTHEALPLATPEPLITKGNPSGFLCPILRFPRKESNGIRSAPAAKIATKSQAETGTTGLMGNSTTEAVP